MKLKIACISENQKKLDNYRELQEKIAPELFEFFQKSATTDEIQSVDGNEVILAKVASVQQTARMPFLVDDVSLLAGGTSYPGALIKHLVKNNTYETLMQFLPEGTPITLQCFIGYFDGFETFIFKGELSGRVSYIGCDHSLAPGLDALIQIDGKPLGSLDKTISHRAKAFVQLVDHIRAVRNVREAHNATVESRWSGRAEAWQSVRDDVSSYVNHENGYERFDTEVRRVLPLVSGSAIDIGCGDGAVTRLIAESSAVTDVLGMDISSEMVRVAAEKTTDARVRFESGIFSGVREKYGLITSRGVVLSHMHQSDVIPTLEAMAESLTPNGYLIFDYISNIANNDDEGRMQKNQLNREWISGTLSELGLVNISFNGSESHRVSVLAFHKPTENSLYFATSNATKVIELQSKCKNHTLHLANIDVSEIKNDDIVEIAKDKARKSFSVLKHPVIVTDGGIFINALNGFPGPNSKQAATLLGPTKLLALLDGESDRTAIRRNCMVYYDGKEYKVCVAEVPLVISDCVTESAYHAYPMDAILIPLHKENPKELTYKQMPIEDRVRFTELPVFEKFITTL